MRKCIIYTRFSPRRNAEDCDSCETQGSTCTAYAKGKKYEIKAVIDDPDASGSDEYREKLWEAISCLCRGDILVVAKRDRLARNLYLSEQINRAVRHKGATIEAVSGDVSGDTPEFVMIRQVLASFAEYERKLIGMRTKSAMRQHQANGRLMGRYPPYGWRIDPDDCKRMVESLAERLAIKTILQLYADNWGYTAIAAKMNDELQDVSRTGEWKATTIRKILKRERPKK